jgi:hypothetical protein
VHRSSEQLLGVMVSSLAPVLVHVLDLSYNVPRDQQVGCHASCMHAVLAVVQQLIRMYMYEGRSTTQHGGGLCVQVPMWLVLVSSCNRL